MSTKDEEFVKQLRATFEGEAEEHLQAISSKLLDLEKSASSSEAATLTEEVFRELHSLKGAARAVDLRDIEGICQSLESIFSVCKRQKVTPAPDAFDAFHRAVDTIRGRLTSAGINRDPAQEPRYEELIRHLGQLQSSLSVLSETGTVSQEPNTTQAPPVQAMPAPSVDSERSASETVRLPVAKLDAQLLHAEEMLTIKAIAGQRAVELRDLVGLFAQWRNRWAKFDTAVRNSRQIAKDSPGAGADSSGPSDVFSDFLAEHADYFRSIGNRLIAMAAESDRDRHRVAKHVNELLENSKALLMLPFSTIAGVFPKLVRDLCRDQEKDAELIIEGADIEIDKRILDQIKDPIVHMLRNCVSHGVERRADRERAGKPPRASIRIAVVPINGNKVEISVSDDGAGVEVEKLKQSAIRQGVMSAADAQLLTDAGALSLVFHSEVSTSQTVTTISGRGLGMAIVRSKVDQLGGKTAIESAPGLGTTLRMLLPVTLSTFRGVLVSVAGQVFVVPALNVERAFRVGSGNIQMMENRETVQVLGKPVSLVRLAAVLELPVKPHDLDPAAPLTVIVLHSADHRIAFAVDEIMHEEEILAKPLRKPLARVRNVAGATILGSGRVVPILNVMDLMKSAMKCGAAPDWIVGAGRQAVMKKKNLLVVEDSVTSRMLLKGILESAGYVVRTAVDGAEAYATLHEGEFDLVVSDVEMPRMNGFDLTVKIRGDKRVAELPVVLVTALESREQRERGMDAGANAYIVKSGFDQGNLLEVIQRLLPTAPHD